MKYARWFLMILVILSLGLFLAGCGKDAEVAETEEEAAPAAEAMTEVDPATAATVTGKIAFEGTAPRARRISMSGTPECEKIHGDQTVYVETVVVNDNGTLKNVFVYIKGGLEGKSFAVSTESAKLDQKGCLYDPRVVGVQANQELLIYASDPDISHNIHPMPEKNREWNTSMPPGAAPLKRKFTRPEIMIPVKCNVHPWMRAYIGVVRHPFFSVSGEDGSFEISGLPPGDYVIEAWHERYGTQEQKVTVTEKESKAVDFTFKG